MVTLIHSLFNEFRSRVVVPGTGTVLYDRRQYTENEQHESIATHISSGARPDGRCPDSNCLTGESISPLGVPDWWRSNFGA